MPGLSAGPAHLALLGTDELLHDFVHTFQSLLLVGPGPRVVAADGCYQSRGAIGHHIADTRMRQEHAFIAGQRRGPEFAADAQVDRDGTIGQPDHFAAELPSSHALAGLQVGKNFVIPPEPVIGWVVARRLPIDAQWLVAESREGAA